MVRGFNVWVIGTAGSGKTHLTNALRDYLLTQEITIATVNLDPAVKNIPYGADIDIRDSIDIDEITERFNLGPNGAMIAATELVVGHMEEIIEDLKDINPDVTLIDTPGQLEIFAYRAAGPLVARFFSPDNTITLFLFDSALVNNPVGYISIALLETSTQLRLKFPMIGILTKSDLLSTEDVQKIVDWSDMPETLQGSLEEEQGMIRELALSLVPALDDLGISSILTPVSSLTSDGIPELASRLSVIGTRGEDWKI
ncbi:MAG: ATP/GTP-binding protein [Promethearchaeota archaeon]